MAEEVAAELEEGVGAWRGEGEAGAVKEEDPAEVEFRNEPEGRLSWGENAEEDWGDVGAEEGCGGGLRSW